jgi:hypothetical protein
VSCGRRRRWVEDGRGGPNCIGIWGLSKLIMHCSTLDMRDKMHSPFACSHLQPHNSYRHAKKNLCTLGTARGWHGAFLAAQLIMHLMREKVQNTSSLFHHFYFTWRKWIALWRGLDSAIVLQLHPKCICMVVWISRWAQPNMQQDSRKPDSIEVPLLLLFNLGTYIYKLLSSLTFLFMFD